MKLNSLIKKWYIKNFADDTYALEFLSPDATFLGLFETLVRKEQIYYYFMLDKNADSVIRERLFQKLSDILKLDYDYIYNLWLSKDN